MNLSYNFKHKNISQNIDRLCGSANVLAEPHKHIKWGFIWAQNQTVVSDHAHRE